MLVFLTCLRKPRLMVVAIEMTNGGHLAIHGEPIGMDIEKTHENGYHDAPVVEVTVFVNFLNHNINVPKSEFFIPIVVSELVESGQSTVEVLRTDSKWFGVTYSEDRPAVVEKFAELHRQGIYPEKMF